MHRYIHQYISPPQHAFVNIFLKMYTGEGEGGEARKWTMVGCDGLMYTLASRIIGLALIKIH